MPAELEVAEEVLGPGRLIHPGPRPPPARPWIRALNRAVHGLMRGLCFGVTVEGLTAFEEAVRAAAAPGRPLLLYAWHCYSWLTYPALAPMEQALRPVTLAHDGPSSTATHRSVALGGHQVLVFQRRAAIPPRQQISSYLRRHPSNLVIFPDSGGPYGQVKPGIIEIARGAGAWLLPFAVHSGGTLELGRTMRHRLPMPRCRLRLVCGEPCDGATASTAACAAALDALERQA